MIVNQTMKMKDEEMKKKKGIWLVTPIKNYRCSSCGKEPFFENITEYKFCPFCGIPMVEYQNYIVDKDGYFVPGSEYNVAMPINIKEG